MTTRRVWTHLGWLVTLVSVFAVPLTADAFGKLTYFTSLAMWLLPAVYLWPLFRHITAPGTGRRRRALRSVIGSIAALGIVLDFLLGHAILRFPGCDAQPSPYVYCLPAIGGQIPVEEILFYALGPAAIVLVYACADELWLNKYNPADDLLNVQLIRPTPGFFVIGLLVLLGLAVMAVVIGSFPTYAAFLSVAVFLPAILLYRSVNTLVNWPAFAVTTLYVALTSVVWEVTLAIPREWWGYEPRGLLLTIDAWSTRESPFPVEAALVWLAAPFSSVLMYEFTKAFLHHPRSSREALFGP